MSWSGVLKESEDMLVEPAMKVMVSGHKVNRPRSISSCLQSHGQLEHNIGISRLSKLTRRYC